jgi:hypothetical protein
MPLLHAPVDAHQTLANNRATVILHVAPNDRPVAGRRATIEIVRIKVGKDAALRSSTVRLRITDSAGTVLLDRTAARRTRFTFPKAGAYRIRVSGSYRLHGRTKRFAVRFPIRARAAA